MEKVSPSAFFSSPVIDLTKSSNDGSPVGRSIKRLCIQTIEIASSSEEDEIRETSATATIASKRRKRERSSSSIVAAVKPDSPSYYGGVEIIEIASRSQEEASYGTRKKSKKTTTDTSTDRAHVVKHIKQGERKSGKEVPNTRPIRQYFCPRTNQPFAYATELQWDFDYGDTEDWLHALSESLINDFDDVSVKEKIFMKLWNRFIKCQHVIADRDIPRKVETFILMNRDKLKGADLRNNLLLHLTNLWDCGLISNNRLSTCMAMYDDEKVPSGLT